METASQRESRLTAERRREEETPSLIGQLRLLDEEWGEGFREDIAAPLAKIIKSLRDGLKSHNEKHEKELDDRDEKMYELEAIGEKNAAAAEELKSLRDDLEDVPRGVRSLEEVMEKYGAVA